MKVSRGFVVGGIVALFIGVHWGEFVERVIRKTMTVQEASQLMVEAQGIHQRASHEIEQWAYTPEQFARDVFRLREIETAAGFLFVSNVEGILKRISDKWLQVPMDPVLSRKIFVEQDRILEPMRKETRRKLFNGLLWLYTNFFPFSFLILLVKRFPVRRLFSASFGDVVCVLSSLVFWPVGIFAYQPKNFFQQRLDYQLSVWKKRVGERGWRLAVAYVFAIVMAVLTTIKPLVVRAQATPVQIVTTIPIPDPTKETDCGTIDPAVIKDLLNSLFTAIRRFFVSFVTPVLVVPARRLLWYLLAQPIRSVPDAVLGNNRIHAPPFVVSDVIHFNTLTTNTGGVYEEVLVFSCPCLFCLVCSRPR